jgi:hypothetical protein
VKRFFGTIWIEELSRHVGRRLPKERLAGAAPTELECLFCPGCYEHFSSYGTETLQSHFGCRTLLAGSLPSNPWGTDETLGIHYPQELNVVHIPDRKGT